MKVSGFTFIRNAIIYDYPCVEAITSILPLCDEVIVAVGKSDDETLSLIQSIPSNKIKIIETLWDDSLRKGGRVLAQETDKALAAINQEADWCFYIQGDEVVHEKYLPVIKKAMIDNKANEKVEGLLFDYVHFYGSYDYVGESTGWYRKEIRVIRNRKDIFSYKDAQGFRKLPNQKLKVKHIDATVYHYGWVRQPDAVKKKLVSFNRLYYSDDWIKVNVPVTEAFEYATVNKLRKFTDTHPQVMQKRIDNLNWTFAYDITKTKRSFKEWIRLSLEKLTGWLPGEYKNYKKMR